MPMLHHLSLAVADLARGGARLPPRGRDNGGAGLHPEYGPDYFAAFVIDPDGYRIQAVITEKT